MRYYVEGFVPTFWEILKVLRYPTNRWGWVLVVLLWPIMANLWLILQLRYGDDWYK